MIRATPLYKAAFDLFYADEKVRRQNSSLRQHEAFAALMRERAPEYVERARELRPELGDDDEGEE